MFRKSEVTQGENSRLKHRKPLKQFIRPILSVASAVKINVTMPPTPHHQTKPRSILLNCEIEAVHLDTSASCVLTQCKIIMKCVETL